MVESVECVVIGAGVIGLAVGREMALSNIETVVLEGQTQIGTGISSRNSEVIHAGIYYPPNSLKAKLCVKGNKMLYSYCDDKNIHYQRCGKLIVATSDTQQTKLQEIQRKAIANQVDDLQLLSQQQVNALEPEIRCKAGLFSPSTGIIDSHGLMLNLQGDIASAGGAIALGSPVVKATCQEQGITLHVGGEQPCVLKAKFVINCAGLHAQPLSQRFAGVPVNTIPPLYYAKGSYFSLSGKSPFSHLIYPLPESAGLGVHSTLDLGGGVKFGPDVEWVDRLDYRVDPTKSTEFYAKIREYWPSLKDDSLHPAYAGIRPKLHPQGVTAHDFMIQTADTHGVKGLVNLYGFESPGLTASLAIGEEVANVLLAS